MSQIVVHAGLFRVLFTDGSVLNGCRKHSYATGGSGWYVFAGRQFSQRELDRWGAKVELQDGAVPAKDRRHWWGTPCPKCGASAGEHCRRLRGLWTGQTHLLYAHPARKEAANRGATA